MDVHPNIGNQLKHTVFLFLIVAAVWLIPSVWAEEVDYDRYAPVWTEGPLKVKPSSTKEALGSFGKHFLVYPFELIRRPIDKTLVYVEDHHLYNKVNWVYEQMKNQGVTPRFRSLSVGRSFGGGFKIDFAQLTRLKDSFPNTLFKGSTYWTLDHITDYQAEIRQDKIAGTGFFAGGKFRYENQGEEHFYGIGPNTSLGDGTSYRAERTSLELPLGYEVSDAVKLTGKFGYQNVNITNGADGRLGIIDDTFVATGRQRIPGLGGDQILSWGLEFEHDNRDDKELPLRGGYERLHFSYNKGMESNAGYFKYRAEAAHFFRLFSNRRTFGLRGVVEHNDEVGGRDVPFFQMARLGGYGVYPRFGDTHRGFRRDRFYDESLMLLNAEYRWTVWEYREWRMDSVLFCDEGQVFGEWSNFQFKDFKPSVGIGFRVSLEGEILLTVEAARSHEGTQFYVKTKAPF